MTGLLSDKRFYFVAFGAVGGLMSALLYHLLEPDSALGTWVVGVGANGMLTAVFLAFGQGRYAGKGFNAADLMKAVIVGGVGGVLGSVVAFYIGFPVAKFLNVSSDVGRFIGWGLSGVAVGIAIAKVVPNLKLKTACVAGGLGAIIGCSLMYVINTVIHGAGLTIGLTTASAIIGLAIATAETAFRHAWLEVTIKPKGLTLEKERTLTVTLGDKPVLFGCAGDADVRLAEMAGAKAHFAKVSLSGSDVTVLDMTTEKSRVIAIDDGFDVSNARVVVRSK
ncbi:hypothetical protein [Rhodospirillum sp. A1_3_36]|uniref:hypothetical protein n=1 Tax=Rhodospirillum sp. A1_3_36 TaxID=3391666 RepID=UPI0039A48800